MRRPARRSSRLLLFAARRLPLLAAVLLVPLLAPLLSGCASLRAIIPGGVSPSDAEWDGVKTAEVVSIAGAIDPRAAAIETILGFLGRGNQLGVLMPVAVAGETQPRWVLCTGDFTTKCASIPINTKVHFAGAALGPGLVWRPTRLTSG